MSHKRPVLLTLLMAVIAIAIGGGVLFSFQTAEASNLSINAATTFASLNDSASDDDGPGADSCLTVNGDLSINNGGSITNNDVGAAANSAGPICIIVTGNLVMNGNAAILAENNNQSGSGGQIDITVGGNMTLFGTSKISSSDNTGGGTTGDAGNINITVGQFSIVPTGSFTTVDRTQIIANSANRTAGYITINVAETALIDGLVQSKGGMSGVPNQPQGGRAIHVDAGCDISVSSTGVISSEGRDPGADLVHLGAGCHVLVQGKVQSIGVGHVVPVLTKNQCNSTTHPDKDPKSTACIEIWGGDSVIIDGPAGGELNADTGASPGGAGEAWIDVFGRDIVTITGRTVLPFAVHANGLSGGGTGNAGHIRVLSRDGTVTANGLALQADSITPGGSAGSINVEAHDNVNLDNATLFARGDFNPSGGLGTGGKIDVRAYNGAISWQAGVADVRPNGVAPITETACVAPITDGTTNFNGATVTRNAGAANCAAGPVPPVYVVLPECPCECVPEDNNF